jgi:hypothetical protein
LGGSSAPAQNAAPVQNPDLQDAASLESLVKVEAARQFPPLTERQRFQVGPIDANLQ